MKRVNFNIEPDCHLLLKSACAIRNISVSDYVYKLICSDFERLIDTDPRIREMFVAGEYCPSSRAEQLKKKIMSKGII